MGLTPQEIADNDQHFLGDFYSLGAWAHEYAAIALYHEAQRVPHDTKIPMPDRPKIQTVLGAKMFAEAVASMETVGKLLYAVRNRHPDGIARRYVNGTEGHSENGLRLFRLPSADMMGALNLPPVESVDNVLGGESIKADCDGMRNHCHNLYEAYLEPGPNGVERKRAVQAYRAIKHGSLILNDPRLVSIWPVQALQGHIWLLTRWPRQPEGKEQLEIMEAGLDQGPVAGYITICKKSSIVCSNLCQLVIRLLQKGLLTYA